LLEKTGCRFVFYSPTTSEIAHEVGAERQMKLVPFLSLADLGETTTTDAQTPDQDITESNKTALIWHSSGPTGLPKLFPMTHRQMLVRSRLNLYTDDRLFINSPLYASAGISFLLFNMHKTAPTLFWNENLPYTSNNLTLALESFRPKYISISPYALKCFAETEQGV